MKEEDEMTGWKRKKIGEGNNMIEEIFLGVNDIKKDLYAEKRGIGALVNRLKGGGCDIWKQRQSRIVYHKEERGKNNEQARATKKT